jgi:hypothetical protein
MNARIIHVGPDERFRVPVLESAGCLVEICESIDSFRSSLICHPAADAVAITDDAPALLMSAASIVLATSAIPLIHFKGEFRGEIESFGSKSRRTPQPDTDFEVDLTIAPLTPPADWVAQVVNFIDESRALRAQLRVRYEESVAIRRASELLRADATAVREKSRLERLRARIEATRNRQDH